MLDKKRFALNRMISPSVSLEKFFVLTRGAGLSAVELRNDLPGREITDGLSSGEVNQLAEKFDVNILSINAVQHFNDPQYYDVAEKEIKELIALALDIGCGAIILCPHNDTNDRRSHETMFEDTREALARYGSLFVESGMTGLVEPLGFKACSLRSKARAIEAIQASGCKEAYKVTHDTFHHYLGTDSTVFPKETGLIHISGVESDIPDDAMRDGHRVLVTGKDRIGNKRQIEELVNTGYTGYVSFEPFADEFQDMSIDKVIQAVRTSVDYLLS
jgi:2-keto-myo-inositol isomerase